MHSNVQVRQRKTNTLISYTWNLKKSKQIYVTEKKQTYRHKELTSGQWGEEREGGQVRSLELSDMNYLYKIDKQQNTVYSTRKYSHYLNGV